MSEKNNLHEKCKEFHVSLIVLTHGYMDHCKNALVIESKESNQGILDALSDLEIKEEK